MYQFNQRTISRVIFSIFFAFSASLAMFNMAQADPLDKARAAGIVGEKQNGYVGLVRAANDNVKKLVDGINLQRRASYRNIAKKRKTSLAAVESLAGKAIIKRLPAGFYYKNAKGKWVKKK